MPITKETISIVENLAYKIHEVESQSQRLRLSDEETEELRSVFDGLKAQIGRFFMKHVDRRSKIRPTSTIEDNYKSFWGLEKKISAAAQAGADEPLKTLNTCKFCGALDVKERRNNATGEVYWYCSTCRQENRVTDLKFKK